MFDKIATYNVPEFSFIFELLYKSVFNYLLFKF